MAKMDSLPFKDVRNRALRPLQAINADIMGPIKPLSCPGLNKFIIVFVDDYSRYARAYSIKYKDESGKVLESFLISARNMLDKEEKVCYIKSDQGTEFTGGKFREVMIQEKIEFKMAPPATPQLNGTAERFNKTFQRKARALMFDSGLSKSMWELALDVAVHVYNRTAQKSKEYTTPLQKFAPKENSHFDYLHRFGCIAYVKISKPDLKFDPRAIKTVLVGYNSNGYTLWHQTTRKLVKQVQ